jgi:hypothetical protein
MRFIPHVSTRLKTVSEAPGHLERTAAPTTIQVASVVAEPGLLQGFLQKQGRSAEVSSELAHRLFGASSALLRANKSLLQLRERFPQDKLSSNALALYNRLLDSWYGELDTALADESEAVRQTGIAIPPDQAVRSGPVDLNSEIEKNRVLLKELIGHDGASLRTAPVVLADLSWSIESLRKAPKEEHEKISQETSSDASSAKFAHP